MLPNRAAALAQLQIKAAALHAPFVISLAAKVQEFWFDLKELQMKKLLYLPSP